MREEIDKLKKQIDELAVFLSRYGIDVKYLSQLQRNINIQLVKKVDEFYDELKEKLKTASAETKPIDLDTFSYKYKDYIKRIIQTLGIIKRTMPWFDIEPVLDAINNVDLKKLWGQTRVTSEHRLIEKNRTYRIQHGSSYCLFYVVEEKGDRMVVEDQQTNKRHQLNKKLFLEKLNSGVITVAA